MTLDNKQRMVHRIAYMSHHRLGVRQKALCNIHRTAVGLRNPCSLDKSNDVFRQNTFCRVCIVSDASSAHILLISDDMTVSVRAPWETLAGVLAQLYWYLQHRSYCLHENRFTVYCAQDLLVQCDELSYSRSSKSHVQCAEENQPKPETVPPTPQTCSNRLVTA